ncbi:uncharacterized protein LOC129600342 [Paramacrobiotus metropolitanus]|uniref:uncharacterized protein LOC129600342 n=1 Tax=Paramacrobiotus metropolitanus TaxID=2943436 RepID=UPI00244612F2|nr:uncharacterized protein LOC129600342 [Paramacrobiotus metropolitanus]
MLFCCVIVLLLASHGLAQTCDQMREQCDALSEWTWTTQGQNEFNSLPWPGTDADYAPYRALADRYCRMLNETAHCKKDLLVRCPDDPDLLARSLSFSPYSIEWSLSMFALCQTGINPLRIIRAERHCKRRTRDVELKFHYDFEQWASQRNVTNVKAAVCQRLDDYVKRLQGPLNTTLSLACGSDAVEAMCDGYRARHTAFCSI